MNKSSVGEERKGVSVRRASMSEAMEVSLGPERMIGGSYEMICPGQI